MPKLPFSVATLVALVLSVAQAQTVGGTVGTGTYQVGDLSATVGQTINLSIPKRFGLHLHRNTWTLNLTNLKSDGTVDGDNGDANCWRAGDHSSGLNGTGRDVLYGFNYFGLVQYTVPVSASQAVRDSALIGDVVFGSVYRGDQATDSSNPYSYKGFLNWFDPRVGGTNNKQPIGGYPGFYVNNDKLEWKGPIKCTFQTVVQKFSNSTAGWQFTAQVADQSATVKFPFALYISDNFTDEVNGLININGPDSSNYNGYFNSPLGSIWHFPQSGGLALRTTDGVAKRLARGYDRNANRGVTTGGWFDDNLLEVLVFDGSIPAGNYGGVVTFALADYSLPTQNGL